MGQRKRSRDEKMRAKLKRAEKRRRRVMRQHAELSRACSEADRHLMTGF